MRQRPPLEQVPKAAGMVVVTENVTIHGSVADCCTGVHRLWQGMSAPGAQRQAAKEPAVVEELVEAAALAPLHRCPRPPLQEDLQSPATSELLSALTLRRPSLLETATTAQRVVQRALRCCRPASAAAGARPQPLQGQEWRAPRVRGSRRPSLDYLQCQLHGCCRPPLGARPQTRDPAVGEHGQPLYEAPRRPVQDYGGCHWPCRQGCHPVVAAMMMREQRLSP